LALRTSWLEGFNLEVSRAWGHSQQWGRGVKPLIITECLGGQIHLKEIFSNLSTTIKVKYKINHIKLKKTCVEKSVSEHCISFRHFCSVEIKTLES